MLTLGILLNQLFDRISQIIQQAQNAGLILEVNAGAQALNLINNARDAFKNSLDQVSNNLSAQQQQIVSEIQGVIDNIQNHVIDDLTANIQTIANTIAGILPGSKTPQVSLFTGAIISPNLTGASTFALKGNFVDVARSGYDAVVNIGSNKIINSIKTTQEIAFQIDRNSFVFSDNAVAYIPVSVDIPFRKTVFLFFHQKKYFTYKFNFIILPKTVGTVTVETTKLQSVRQVIDGVCSNKVWDSSDDDIDKVDGCGMEDGWQCMPETVRYSFSRQEGDWSDFGNVSTPTFAGWHFKTRHHGIGTSGKLTAAFTYKKWKDIPQQESASIAVLLNWGDVKVLTVDPTASWKIIYRQFDGVVKEYATSDQTNPYIKISSAGNTLSFKVVPQ